MNVLPRLLTCLLAGCLDGGSLALDGSSSNHDLYVEAHAQYALCAERPCTSISVEIRRVNEAGSTYAPDTAARVSVDGEPAVDMPFEDDPVIPNGRTFGLGVDGWIQSLRIDVTAGSDAASLWADAAISTPYEASIELPDTIVLGSSAELRWTAQAHAHASVIYATDAPALRFGFLQTDKRDTGNFELTTALLSAPGMYTIALYRSITHYNDDLGLTLVWGSNWQKRVTVLNVPSS